VKEFLQLVERVNALFDYVLFEDGEKGLGMVLYAIQILLLQVLIRCNNYLVTVANEIPIILTQILP
jgi:hypothetical protein